MKNFGLTTLLVDLPVASVMLVLALAFLFYMHRMYQRQLDDRQKELDRLAKENREYRKMFLSLVRVDAGISHEDPFDEETR